MMIKEYTSFFTDDKFNEKIMSTSDVIDYIKDYNNFFNGDI